jgi:hypothetical protein
VPESDPQPGRTHILQTPPERQANGTYTGGVWAGSVLAGTWHAAGASWTIPYVDYPGELAGNEGGWNSSSWVGLDGTYGSNDVLQAGIEQRLLPGGGATYVAWYEWFAPAQPNSPAYINQTNIQNFPVTAGQEVQCTVQYIGTTAGTIWFMNHTTGAAFSITLAPPPGATFSGNTAEWIMEAPDGGIPTSSLPSFTPVTFTGAVCLGPSPVRPTGDAQSGDTWNIVGRDGLTLTSVSLAPAQATIYYIGPAEVW